MLIDKRIMTLERKLIIITDSHYFDHDTGGLDHPENPVRLEVIIDSLVASPIVPFLDFVTPRPASRQQLLTSHTESWLFRFEELALSGRTYIDHVDNQICYDSYNVAVLAAGAALTGIDLLERDHEKQVFCMVRPPGHHAERSGAYGFCYFNNCVLAARYWQNQYNRRRVLIIDFDAHHGNGIQAAFEQEAGSYYISIHEHPSFSYPGTGYADETGSGEGAETILNLPLKPGAGDRDVLKLFDEIIEPRIVEWQPDAIVVAAGFDAHIKDDMSGLEFSTQVYGKIGERIRRWGKTYTNGKILSVLEGGYELTVLGESVEAYLSGLFRK